MEAGAACWIGKLTMSNTNDDRIPTDIPIGEVLQCGRQDLSVIRGAELTHFCTQQLAQLCITTAHKLFDLHHDRVPTSLQPDCDTRPTLLRRLDYLLDMLPLTRNRPLNKHILARADAWNNGFVVLVNSGIAYDYINIWVSREVLGRAVGLGVSREVVSLYC